MRKSGNGILMIQIGCMEQDQAFAFYEAMDAAWKHDKDAANKAEEDYRKQSRAIQLGYEMLLIGELAEWDWVWAAKNGHLCQKDFEWFAEDLAKVGVKSYEDFIANWYKPEPRRKNEEVNSSGG